MSVGPLSDAQISLYSAVVQLIPVLVLAVFFGGRQIHPEVKRNLKGPVVAVAQMVGAGVATVLAGAMLYVGLNVPFAAAVVLLDVALLFAAVVGTAKDVSRSLALYERDARQAVELDNRPGES